mgnify:CR=1 FL=1|jgi:hypothetical protein
MHSKTEKFMFIYTKIITQCQPLYKQFEVNDRAVRATSTATKHGHGCV